MNRITQTVRKFMQGRYGMDILSRDLMWLTLFLVLINLFFKSTLLSMIPLMIFIIIYYRMFSKKYTKRYNENRIYANQKLKFIKKTRHSWQRLKDFRKYKYFNCPQCKQTLRVPRGKKEITITCSRCQTKFDGRS